MKHALAWGKPPTGLLRHSNEWLEEDYILASAYSMWEDGLCPCGCGYPRNVAWDEGMDGWFEAREEVCYAKAARERWENEHSERNKDGSLRYPPKLGSMLYVADARVESPED